MERFKDSNFFQQNLPAIRVNATPFTYGILCFICCSVSFIFFLISYFLNRDLIFLQEKYNESTKLTFDVPDKFRGILYCYYIITNFYQNNFLYMSSKSWDMLTGAPLDKSSTNYKCSPSLNVSGKILAPCGSVARSLFNDSFVLEPTVSKPEKGRFMQQFKDFDSSYNISDVNMWMNEAPYDELYPDGITDSRFIIWMRASMTKNIKKLYGRIPDGTSKLTVVVEANYNVSAFGERCFVVQSSGTIGGKNNFMFIYFIVLAIFYGCAGSGLIFLHFMHSKSDIQSQNRLFAELS